MISEIKNKIARREAVLAVNPGGVSLPVVDVLGRCRVDLLFIDCERTPISVEGVNLMVRAAHANRMPAVVRSPSKDVALLLRYFDCGVDGIVLPSVESVDDVERLQTAATLARVEHDRALLLIAQLESKAGVDAFDEITAQQCIDLFLIGPNDLATSLGYPGTPQRAEVQGVISDMIARLNDLGRPFGIPASEQNLAQLISQRCAFLYTTVDKFLTSSISEFQDLLAKLTNKQS